MTDYTKLKQLAEAATPGPWEVTWYVCKADKYDVEAGEATEVGEEFWRVPKYIGPLSADNNPWSGSHIECSEADANFITAANPTAVLQMIAEIEELKKEIGSKQADIDRLMLEFCPEDMTIEQVEEWSRNQRPANLANNKD